MKRTISYAADNKHYVCTECYKECLEVYAKKDLWVCRKCFEKGRKVKK